MFWYEHRVTIWVAIVLSTAFLVWAVTLDFPAADPPEPRPVTTTEWPDFVNERTRG